MIVVVALLFCVVATAVLFLIAVNDMRVAQEHEAIARHEEAMAAIDPRRWT